MPEGERQSGGDPSREAGPRRAPERSGRLTEAVNPRTTAIDRADPREIVRLIQAEDRRVPEAVEAEADRLAALIDEVARRMEAGGRLVYVGAGTSGRLGVLDAAECPPTFGTDPDRVVGLIAGGEPALVRSREGAEDDRGAGRDAVREAGVEAGDFVLGIATSGTTPYVAAALEEAAARGAGTGLLSCTPPPSDLAGRVDHRITPLVGPEVIAGSTRMKAGTATKLVLNTLSTGVMIRLGKVYGNLMVDLRAGSRKLVERALGILERVCGIGRAEGRALLLRAGGSARTAIAMHELGVDRALAERLLDACGGFLREAVERFGGRGRPPYFACYPEALAEDEPARLLGRLARGPERLREACRERSRRAEREGGAGGGRGWSPARHVAHLAEAEAACFRPRVEALVASASRAGEAAPGRSGPPAFVDWTASPEPPLGGKSVPETLLAFAAERARTVEALRGAPPEAWDAPGTLDGEAFRLHQMVRAMIQHDGAHAERIREWIHPDLLESGS